MREYSMGFVPMFKEALLYHESIVDHDDETEFVFTILGPKESRDNILGVYRRAMVLPSMQRAWT